MTEQIMSRDELATHFDRQKRKAMCRMAQSLNLAPKTWAEAADVNLTGYDLESPTGRTAAWDAIARQLPPERMLRLLNEVSEAIAGGVPNTAATVEGDPFAVFVTGTCTDAHEGRGNHKQTAVVKTGNMVDQAEGERIFAYLKAQDNVNTCEVCGKSIHTWSLDNTRVSTFAAAEQVGRQMAEPVSILRGSDL